MNRKKKKNLLILFSKKKEYFFPEREGRGKARIVRVIKETVRQRPFHGLEKAKRYHGKVPPIPDETAH